MREAPSRRERIGKLFKNFRKGWDNPRAQNSASERSTPASKPDERLPKSSSSDYLDPLSRLAIRYGTDKFGEHLYTPIYHKLFAHLREKPLRLLEIGVGGYENPLQGGQSLRMWADYFPYGQIVGLDFYAKRLSLPQRVKVLQGSQADPALLDTIWSEHGPFDIVIDDGSHRADHILASFRQLYPRMCPDAFYVIEDTQTAFWPEFGGNTEAKGSIYDLAHQVGLAMHYSEVRALGKEPAFTRYGDITASIQILRNLVVFERGTNDYPSNYAFDMKHPAVNRVHNLVISESAREPSPGAFLTRLEMEMRTTDRTEATASLALDAVRAYPEHSDILFTALRALKPSSKSTEYGTILNKLTAMFPHEPFIRNLAREVSGNPTETNIEGNKRLTIVCSAYKRPQNLLLLIDCLLCQTLQNFKLLIVHDGEDKNMHYLLSEAKNQHKNLIEFMFTPTRYNDFGHSLREIGIDKCQSEFIMFTNDDNYYTPRFLEYMFKEIDQENLDFVLCDMVHSHEKPGGRPQGSYTAFTTEPKKFGVDIGCFIVKSALAKAVGFRDKSHDGDGTFVDDLINGSGQQVRWGKVDKILFVHN